ncbi:MAG: FAD-dependent oxidoreductase [Oculatellaceae cyanobacterium Prado106]|nr:FAD-dependent oxidoreductase [Oculatellaceae cyanobacterium Prado106]
MLPINRRTLLKFTLWSSASLVSCDRLTAFADSTSTPVNSTTPSGTSSGPPSDVLVIGAGVAGLAAAQVLQSKGYQVRVLEGRDRIGGRLWTNRALQNIPLDLGASWIHGVRNNPLTEIARQAGIATVPTDYNASILYDRNGQVISDTRVSQIEQRFDRLLAKLEQERSTLEAANKPDISLQQAIQRVTAHYALNRRELAELDYAINNAIELEYAADVSQLSLYSWDAGSEFAGRDVLFPGGYEAIATHLAQGLTIELQQTVQRIEQDASGVRVFTNRGSFSAAKVVITLPLGVLQSGAVQFSPALPRSKRVAMQKLGMGILNKVYFQFPQAFWDEDSEILGYVSPQQGQWCEFYNYQKYLNQPILMGFNAGTYGRQIEAFSDDRIVRDGMNTLRRIYGNRIPNPTGWLITRWQQDPFARGSYSYIGVGGEGGDRDKLAEPVNNRLFFAGEATSKAYPSTVHGALLSGRRAANQVMS